MCKKYSYPVHQLSSLFSHSIVFCLPIHATITFQVINIFIETWESYTFVDLEENNKHKKWVEGSLRLS